MASVIQLNQVSDAQLTANESKRIFLIKTLKPLWKMTHYTGLLLDWVGSPNTDQTGSSPSASVFKILPRIIVIFFALSSLFGLAVFEMYELVVKIIGLQYSSAIIANLVINIVFLLPLAHACFNLFHFISINQKLRKLIKSFHFFESQHLLMACKKRFDRVEKRRKSSYTIIFGTNLFTFIGITFMTFQAPDFTVFLTTSETLCAIFPIPLLQAYQVAVFLLVVLYQILTDLIPSFVYYHAGAAVLAIHDEIRHIKAAPMQEVIKQDFHPSSSTDNEIDVEEKHGEPMEAQHRIFLQIWSKYNLLRQLVKKVDRLFGWMSLLDYGVKFFMICLMSYTILLNSRYSPLIDIIIAFIIMLGYLMRLFCCVALKSELHQSREKLISLMAAYLNTHWLDICKEERQVFSAFQAQVNRDQLAASPKGIFVVNPALLLTMLSLIVSYLIVLLQSN